jgi:hypothetical protein
MVVTQGRVKQQMKSVWKILLIPIFVLIQCVPINATKYIDGRFIANEELQKHIKREVKNSDAYHRHKLDCYEDAKQKKREKIWRSRMNFSILMKRKGVRCVEVSVPLVNCDSRREERTFYVVLTPHKKLNCFELVNLFLKDNRLNAGDFAFKVGTITTMAFQFMDEVNEYGNRYSLTTDVTEENWTDKFFDPDDDARMGAYGDRLQFFETGPDEKTFVSVYES